MKEALQHLLSKIEPFKLLTNPKSLSELAAHHNDVQIESLERFQAAPNRIKQGVTLNSTASFCSYIELFGDNDSSIFLDAENAKFVAALDYHGPDDPSWCDHLASFNPKRSMQWLTWNGVHGIPIGQVKLAHFIEANVNDIIEPEPNEVLQAALEFQANERMTLGSTMGLDDGSVKFVFTKDNVAKEVAFPHRIKIRIPVFENESVDRFEVRIRYKIDGDGRLEFTVSFVRDPDMIVRKELLAMAANIRETCEGKHVYEGALSARNQFGS